MKLLALDPRTEMREKQNKLLLFGFHPRRKENNRIILLMLHLDLRTEMRELLYFMVVMRVILWWSYVVVMEGERERTKWFCGLVFNTKMSKVKC